MKKRFVALAEGLIAEKCLDNKTAIELFLAGVRSWGIGLRLQLSNGTSNRR